jgi:UDP-2-acetamido-2-deoxy-ribo-hexuluronate aminotransferase
MDVERVAFIDLEPWVQKVRGGGPFMGAVENDLFKILDSREFLGGGPTTQKLEAALTHKLGVPHVITCANGTDALQLALRACGIDSGHRVAMPNVTFWGTYEAIMNVGATPVLLDIDPGDRQMDFEEFKRAHNEKRFDAAILVHLYGWCSSRLAEFRAFARERRITLIEDGAQAFGVQVDGASVFSDADVATLSFHPAKVLGGIGDGGAVICKSVRTASRVRSLANHGRAGSQHEHVVAGWNSRLDAIQAAWLLRALDVVDEVINARQDLHTKYQEALYAIIAGAKPSDLIDVHPGIATNGYMTVFDSNPTPAAEIIQCLAAQGIEARRIYPHTIADFAHGAIEYGPLTHSRALVEHVVSLPLYYGMTDETVERCVKAYVAAVK